MEQAEIHKRVVKVICDVLNVDEELVTIECYFIFDLGAESTQSIQLVAGFEEEFGIEMDNEAALSIKTVDKAIEFIGQYVSDA